VVNWNDFRSTTKKLKIICSNLKADADFETEPWITAKWLVEFGIKLHTQNLK